MKTFREVVKEPFIIFIVGFFLIVTAFWTGHYVGKSEPLEIKDAEVLLTFNHGNPSSISIYNFRGFWEITARFEIECGRQTIESGEHKKFEDAVKSIKEKYECLLTCGDKK